MVIEASSLAPSSGFDSRPGQDLSVVEFAWNMQPKTCKLGQLVTTNCLVGVNVSVNVVCLCIYISPVIDCVWHTMYYLSLFLNYSVQNLYCRPDLDYLNKCKKAININTTQHYPAKNEL